jgi:tetratricopeptide (TPR) repeat protein/predicted Ser/Thr protein kinase
MVSSSGDSSRPGDLATLVELDESNSRRSLGSIGAHPERSRIGRFALLRRLGVGGMGVVYVGYDEQLDRRVAIKVLRPDVEARDRARVAREARSLARLTHPNVVQVYEVGAEEDDLFIAMEYVAGQDLDRWQSETARPWRDVLAVYLQAGLGLAAAHAAGLVHRDFKPLNVVVTDDGVAKVLDFGIARHETETELPDHPSLEASDSRSSPQLTVTGRMLGTPAYMAPEQFESPVVTEAADQFSFCVSLWEGLYGQRPFAGESMAELLGALSRGELVEPPTRSGVPPRIRRIVERGLSRTPDDRWPSMSALLEALATDPRRQRRRWLVGGGLGIGAVALLALQPWSKDASLCSGAAEQLAEAWGPDRREEAHRAFEATALPYAEMAWSATSERLDAFAADWTDMYTEACEATAVRAEQSERVLDLRMACLHRAKVELEATSRVLTTADADTLEHVHRVTEDLMDIRQCADIDALQSDSATPPPSEAAAVERARESLARASAEYRAGHYDTAMQQVVEAKKALGDVQFVAAHMDATIVEGRLLRSKGEFDEAEAVLTHGLELAMKAENVARMQSFAAALLSLVGSDLGRSEEALHRYEALAVQLTTEDSLARADALSALGSVRSEQQKYAKAEVAYRSALDIWRRVLDEGDLRVASGLNNLAGPMFFQDRFDEAESLVRRALEIRRARLGDDHPVVARTRANLAMVLSKLGRTDEALRQHQLALESRVKALGPSHPEVGDSHESLAIAYSEAEELDQTVVHMQRALEIQTEALGPDHPRIANTRRSVGLALRKVGRYEEAEEELRGALRATEASLPEDHPALASARDTLAELLLTRGRADEALPLAQLAWARNSQGDIRVGRRAGTGFVLARAQWETATNDDERQESRRLANVALEAYEAERPRFEEEAATVRRWLESH